MGGLSSTGFSSKCDYLARVPAIVIVIVIRTNIVVLLSALTLPKGLFSVHRSTTDSSLMSPTNAAPCTIFHVYVINLFDDQDGRRN